jgi:hypothetical protein
MNTCLLNGNRLPLAAATAVVASLLMLTPAASQAGGYIGGSVGQSYIELDAGTPTVPETFDEKDLGFKAFLGYEFPLAVINLGVEGSYIDLGAPAGDVLGANVEVDTNGFAGFGTASFDLGPIGVFGKYGLIAWDAQFSADGIDSGSDDGTDPAYGVGVKFGLGSLEIRGEYEIFDIKDSEDVAMLSVGLVWRF